MTDPAIVKAPWGPEVDGRRLLGEAVGFGRSLRAVTTVDRPRRRGRLRAGPDPGRSRRPRAGPGRRRRPVRPASRRPAGLRRGLRPLVAPTERSRSGRSSNPRRSAGRRRPPPRRRSRAPTPPEPGSERADVAAGRARNADPVGLERGRRRRIADRGDRRLARRLLARRGPAPPRVRPDDAGGAA